MADRKYIPGNAILLNGGLSATNNANREIGVPRTLHESALPSTGWHSRGYLPHFESSEATQHVTFHLADSLPQATLQQLESELRAVPTGKQDAERRKRIDAWIDAGHGSCILRAPAIANIVQDSLLIFDSKRYRLLAWVVMPNHVHVLFQPINPWTVAKIVASRKKFSARKICDHCRNIGDQSLDPVWHREYWDRFIRDKTHLAQTLEYIHQNPVQAGLVTSPESWRWSSAYPPGTPTLPHHAGLAG